jgi:DNA/RNA endonuclease YhcR with UshA esterase domain
MGMGIHLNLQTDKETIAVHLGPDWFMKKQSPQIETGDAIEVTGSRVTFDGKPAIIAAEIKKGNKVIKLRDQNGVPLWSGRGRQGQ